MKLLKMLCNKKIFQVKVIEIVFKSCIHNIPDYNKAVFTRIKNKLGQLLSVKIDLLGRNASEYYKLH